MSTTRKLHAKDLKAGITVKAKRTYRETYGKPEYSIVTAYYLDPRDGERTIKLNNESMQYTEGYFLKHYKLVIED